MISNKKLRRLLDKVQNHVYEDERDQVGQLTGQVVMPRAMLESIMELCAETDERVFGPIEEEQG